MSEANQALYRKYRPKTWQEVLGQSHITQTLQNAITSGRLVHAYLFAGPRGTGKTTTARLLAKALNCTDPDPANRPCNKCSNCLAVNDNRFLDLIEIDAASNTSVDDIRDLRDKVRFSPSMGKYKVYIIDEIHMLSTSAFNALLKTLEEPPEHAIFILATTEIHKILPTVLSRCQRHEFRRISINDIVLELEKIVAAEKMDVDDNVLTLIARQSTGAMRDAISLLDQLTSSGQKVTLEYAHNILGTAGNQSVIQVVEDILALETARGLEHIHTALDSGIDTRQYARQIVDYLRSVLMYKMGNPLAEDLPADIREKTEAHARQFEKEHLLLCLQRFNSVAAEARGNWQPSLSLEMAFAETCVPLNVSASITHAADPAPSAVLPQRMPLQSVIPQPAAPVPGNVKAASAKKQSADVKPASETKLPAETTAPQIRTQPSAEVPQPAAGSQDEKLMYKKLHENWKEIQKQIRQISPPVEALFNSCSLHAVNGTVVQLATSEFIKSKIESKESLSIIEPSISRLLGIKIAIQCVVLKNNPGSSNDVSQNEDGMVNAALGLGGQIIQQD